MNKEVKKGKTFSEILYEVEMGNIEFKKESCWIADMAKFQKKYAKLKLKKDDYVKIKFTDLDEVEWMWLQIMEVLDDNQFIGRLDNVPISIENLKLNDLVHFRFDDIVNAIVNGKKING